MTTNRSACTLGRGCQPQTLAQHIYCDARHAELDPQAIAERLNVGVDWFRKKTSDAGPADAPAWLLLAIASLTRRRSGIAYLAREAGLITFAPILAPGSHSERALSPVVRSFSAWVDQFEATYEDGVCSRDEAIAATQAAHVHAAELFARVNAIRRAAGLPDIDAPGAPDSPLVTREGAVS